MIKKIIKWIKSLFKPKVKTTYYPPKPVKITTAPPKATEVVNDWIVTKYHDQNICLRKTEIQRWNRLNRKGRRDMARKFHDLEKKGKIIFQEIEGKTIAIWNKSYGIQKDAK